MIKRVEFSREFSKQLSKSPMKIKLAFRDRLKMFIADRDNQMLHNHTLKGELKAYRSMNITGDWRAIFREFEGGEIIFFDKLGTHSQLYKK